MKIIPAFFALTLFLSAAGPARSEQQSSPGIAGAEEGASLMLKVPLFSSRFARVPVAEVNDEPITLEEFGKALGMVHSGKSEGTTQAKKDYGKILQRLVTAKLIVQEARAMNMCELPEVKKQIDNYKNITLREILREQLIKDVKADDAEVEKVYRESIREFRLRSVMFKNEDDAKAMAKAVAEGKTFEELTEEAAVSKTARGSGKAETVKASDLNPAIAAALSGMRAGMVSQPVPIQPGFVVFKVEDIRSVESPEARERAHRQVLKRKQNESLIARNNLLSKKYLTFNKKRIESLDFSGQEGMEKLLQDKRVIVQVKGEKPVTVGDLARAIEEKLYHGAGKNPSKKINNRKTDALEELLAKRLLLAEALKRGIDRTDEYKGKIKEYEENVLFGMFVQRVIAPQSKPSEDELKAYYEQHRKEYLASPKVRFESLVFFKREDAEEALAKLRKGTEMRWLRENAAGQPDRKTSWVPDFGNNLLAIDDLPEDLQKALADARAGDMRLASGPRGYHYVLVVQEAVPAEQLNFEQVADAVKKKVHDEKIQNVLDAWTEKLKKNDEVTLYLKGGDTGM